MSHKRVTKEMVTEVTVCDVCGQDIILRCNANKCYICGKDICVECTKGDDMWFHYCPHCWEVGEVYYRQLEELDKSHAFDRDRVISEWKKTSAIKRGLK